MRTKPSRYLGVDLHHDSFVVCTREGGQQQFQHWKMEQIEEFVASLRRGDCVAVEATGNTRWFCQRIGERVQRRVVVNPHQFRLISQSVKKTDRRDAALLAEYLEKDLLPEVRPKTLQESELAQLVSGRDQLVKIRTMLKNQLHGLLRSYGLRVSKQGMSSNKQRKQLATLELPVLADVHRRVLLEQIASIGCAILELEQQIKPAAEQLPGYRNIASIRGIGALKKAPVSCFRPSVACRTSPNPANWRPTLAWSQPYSSPTRANTMATSLARATSWHAQPWCSAPWWPSATTQSCEVFTSASAVVAARGRPLWPRLANYSRSSTTR